MFKKDIDTNDPKTAREFLSNHCRYYTMNSWNQLASYANNVRLTRIGLTPDELTFVFDTILDPDCDTFDYDIAQKDLIDTFETEHHCEVYFNGRSGGSLVMIPRDLNGRGLVRGYPHAEDIEYDDDAIELAKTVDAFDRLCDDLADLVRDFAKNGHVEEEEVTYTVTKTVRQLTLD